MSMKENKEEVNILNHKHGIGCLKSPYDARDYQFADLVVAVDRTEYPEEHEPIVRPKLFDQGSTSMCCACATAMSRYIYEFGDSGNTNLLSPAYIYGNRAESNIVDGIYTGEGMYLKDALKQLINAGDCYYDSLNSWGDYAECHKSYEAKKDLLDTEALPFRVSSYYAVKTTKQIQKAIIETGSVLASFIVTTGWYYTGKDGIIDMAGNIEGGHAILIVGWKKINNKTYWIILNSWGEEWGDEGYGYIESTEMMMEAYCILDDIHELHLKNEEEN